MIIDAVFHHILGAFSLKGSQLVHFIHLIPVDLADVHIVQPAIGNQISRCIRSLIARKITIVIRFRRSHVIPIESAAGRFSERSAESRNQGIFLVGRFPEMRKEDQWFAS